MRRLSIGMYIVLVCVFDQRSALAVGNAEVAQKDRAGIDSLYSALNKNPMPKFELIQTPTIVTPISAKMSNVCSESKLGFKSEEPTTAQYKLNGCTQVKFNGETISVVVAHEEDTKAALAMFHPTPAKDVRVDKVQGDYQIVPEDALDALADMLPKSGVVFANAEGLSTREKFDYILATELPPKPQHLNREFAENAILYIVKSLELASFTLGSGTKNVKIKIETFKTQNFTAYAATRTISNGLPEVKTKYIGNDLQLTCFAHKNGLQNCFDYLMGLNIIK